MKLVIATALVTLLPFAVAAADPGGGPPGGGPPGGHTPPPEAFAACAKLAQGAACTVTLGDHSITGTCEKAPDQTALACRPDHPPGPPPEAVAACQSSKEGDSCTVTFGSHSESGTCSKGPDGSGTLACHPAGGRGPR